MEENPSGVKDEYALVYDVSYYQAVVFCNRMSVAAGLAPAYELDKTTDVEKWGAVPSGNDKKWNKIKLNKKADGFRLEFDAKKFKAEKDTGFFVLVK